MKFEIEWVRELTKEDLLRKIEYFSAKKVLVGTWSVVSEGVRFCRWVKVPGRKSVSKRKQSVI